MEVKDGEGHLVILPANVDWKTVTEEYWKAVDGFPSYEVSNRGRIKSLHGEGRILKPGLGGNGYYSVVLYENGKKSTHTIHQLVGETFIGKLTPGMMFNHKDGCKTNNELFNLELISCGENIKHAMDTGLNNHPRPVRIVETGEIFKSMAECAKSIGGDTADISMCISGRLKTHKQLHFESATREEYIRHANKQNNKEFLYPHQREALTRMFNGCLLNGGTGSGKSRTGIYYFFQKNGGSIEHQVYTPMRPNPPDLYIITTAKKVYDRDWEGELVPFLLYPDPKTRRTRYGNKITIASWNVIQKYTDVKNAQFIFDENKCQGKGAWAKAFLKITKNNEWIILSATNGDRWEDYETVFIAHGFFRTRGEFRQEHLVYDPYVKNFPKIQGYRNETRLLRLRDRLLIDMDFERHTNQIHEDVYCNYDMKTYKDVLRNRWDIFKDEPITQAAGLCYVLRRIVNSDQSRQVKLLELLEDHPRAIVFYSFDYELDILLNLGYPEGTIVAQYNGHVHERLPDGERWVYLVNYSAGAEGFNAITTDTVIFFSQTYSYKVLTQASGRIDRITSPFTDLHYYHLKTRSGIDLAISKALKNKKKFNERKFAGFD